MSKKTSKQLGIPSNFRLTGNTVDNIKRVALRKKYGTRIMKFAWDECDLMMCISAQLYGADQLKIYRDVCSELLGINGRDSIRYQKDIEMKNYRLGCSGYHYYRENRGILSHPMFEDLLDSMTREEFKDFGLPHNTNTTQSYQWLEAFAVIMEPVYHGAVLSNGKAWERLSSKMKKKVTCFMKKVAIFCEKIKVSDELYSQLLNTYTSAVKLCNDAPEFIELINEAAGYNKKGKKCTDVGTADIIQQLRKG